jgi:hypothetical protein
MTLRISESFKLGRIRVGASVPVTGRGRARVWAGTRTGRRGWLGVSETAGGKRRRAR